MHLTSPLRRSLEYKCFCESHGSTGSLTVLSDPVLYAVKNQVYLGPYSLSNLLKLLLYVNKLIAASLE